ERSASKGRRCTTFLRGILARASATALEVRRDAPVCLESAVYQSAGGSRAIALQLSDCSNYGCDTVAARRTAGSAGEIRSSTESGRANAAGVARSEAGSARPCRAKRVGERAGLATEDFNRARAKLRGLPAGETIVRAARRAAEAAQRGSRCRFRESFGGKGTGSRR